MFHDARIQTLRKIDIAGITTWWDLSSLKARGKRGLAIALDPRFPLAAEVRTLLLALGKSFPVNVKSEMTQTERIIPKLNRRYSLEPMFFSKTRLSVLACLENQGGRVKLSTLAASIPDQRNQTIRRMALQMVKGKILRREGIFVGFCEAPWTSSLRKLLRAYLRSNPALRARIKSYASTVRITHADGHKNMLLGRSAAQRALIALALHGPLTRAELERHAYVRAAPPAVKKLTTSGIISVKQIPRVGFRPIRYYDMIGLNAKHPIYAELLALLCKISNGKPSRKPQLRCSGSFSIEGLFLNKNRLRMLMAIALAFHSYIYPASMRRLFPRLYLWTVNNILRTWAKDTKGIVRRVGRMKTPAYYELNPDFPHYRPLKNLLLKIAAVWPEYRIAADTEPALQPSRAARYGRAKIHR